MISKRFLLTTAVTALLQIGFAAAGESRAQQPVPPSPGSPEAPQTPASPPVPEVPAPIPTPPLRPGQSPSLPPPPEPPTAPVAPAAPTQAAPLPAAPAAHVAGATAEDGSSEKFYAEFRETEAREDASPRVEGWDAAVNAAITDGRVAPAKANVPMSLAKMLTTADPSNLMAQSLMYFGAASAPNSANCFGFNNAEPGSLASAPTQRFAVCFGNNSAYLLNGGTSTPLNRPNAAGFISVTFWLSANGDLSLSMVKLGTNEAVPNTFPGIVPPAHLTHFELSGLSPTDRQYGSRYAVSAGGAPGQINMAYDGGTHPGGAAVLSSLRAGGVFALIPPDYKPDAPNRAVFYLHGLHEVGWSVSCQAPYSGCNAGVATVSSALMKAGYVVVGVDSADTACYGNAACVADLSTAVSEFQARLSIGGGLYGFADSMGGFQLLNAITHGAFAPRAIAACCLNTNLADDYFPDYKAPGSEMVAPEAGTAKGVIDSAYRITPETPYETATAGYDPLLASGEALQHLVAVPAMLWASSGDRVVNRTYNSDQYASTVNAAGGSVVVVSCKGDHEDLSCFDPAALLTFFGQH